MPDQDNSQANGSLAVARAAKSYFQLLSDLAGIGSMSYQIYADQIMPQNILALNNTSPWISATATSVNKVTDLVPKAWEKYLNSL